ncbi:ESX secretion-associated protein EspG [Actinokineospora cianjurensis]|uniref:ESAT-6 protein secretion system EspG family protein n=1 Tax=Actinokineospora cianjurensis TaxID=585224 RepID=A0A421B855_9PSEU|nr:ESX secretion-associated protein EspG [Actinokineospora cianjurensis]RLK60488.1 ESAT-6 protein secretion system EspG family protein [Actinokineospora cianjurensis]
MPRSFTLSLAAVDTLGQVLGVNPRLFPFEVPSFGRLFDDRARIAKAVFTDLYGRGLIGRDEVDTDVEAALRITSEHDVGIGVMGTVEKDRPIRARAAILGTTAVLAVQEGQTIRFDLMAPSSVAKALVDLLPKAQAGPGQSVMVTEVLQAQESGYVRPVRAARSTSDTQLRLAATMLERPRTGFGFYAVSGKGRHGREVEAGTVGWIDTESGRYLSVTRPQPDGAIRATYSPADATRLTRQLDELITTATPRR